MTRRLFQILRRYYSTEQHAFKTSENPIKATTKPAEFCPMYNDTDLGGYGAITPVHMQIAREARPFIRHAIENMNRSSDDPSHFHMVDYGAADGATSLSLVREAIDIVKDKFGADRGFQISYEDQKFNNYAALIDTVYGKDDNETLSRKNRSIPQQQNTFVSICPTSFYKQCFPNASVDLGISFCAMHWMQNSPGPLQNGLIHISSNDQSEIEAYGNEARRGYETNLLHRAREMKPGGRMIIGMPGVDGVPLREMPIFKGAMKKLEMCWLGMLQDGLIEKNEYVNANFGIYFWNGSELRAPFEDVDSAVSKSGLRLISTEAKVIPFPNSHRLLNGSHDEVLRTAKAMVTSVRAWSNSSILHGLSDERTDADKALIADELYRRYWMDAVRNPTDLDVAISIVYLYLRKEE